MSTATKPKPATVAAPAEPVPTPDAIRSKARQKASAKLLEKDLRLQEHARAIFDVTLPAGMQFEECLEPDFWAVVAFRFGRRPGVVTDLTGAIINIGRVDHAFFAQLYVRAVHPKSLDVAVLREPVYFGPQDDETVDGFEIRWNAADKGFDILKGANIVGRARDFKLREKALLWVAANKG